MIVISEWVIMVFWQRRGRTSAAPPVLCKCGKPQFNMSDIMSVCFLRLTTDRGGVCRCVWRATGGRADRWRGERPSTKKKTKKKPPTRFVLFSFEMETYWQSLLEDAPSRHIKNQYADQNGGVPGSHLFRRWCRAQVKREESHRPWTQRVLKRRKGERKESEFFFLAEALSPLYRTLTCSALKRL